ncbi:LOW QUALITY PROTEIN: beta-hexosaminidase subunit beta-like [Pomacea canaliculata]|uniref:LOW QUALITY PROTEIN: beta-hexosaminidase subunit beta-like n=1 Tax=Pomacea canaliculata TaxID=400727 RepID=UPI000D7267E0|nr:LOW QUALITY PROTEIN: beta-hexosaminidase subunit beta-like [Pomacea canaliculata]
MAAVCRVALVVAALGVQYSGQEIMFIADRLPLQGNKDHADVPWPLPARWRSNTSFPLLHETLSITSNVPGCDVIDNAAKRYRGIVGSLGKAAEPQQGGIGHVMIFVENATCEKFPHLKMDESYELTVFPSNVTINSRSAWGALRGLETFSQLVYEKGGMAYVKEWNIEDSPRFAHRGFMMDTARHFLPLKIIKLHLEAMAWSKLNVFHWHIVDAQSFPFVSRRFPELSDKGAFSPRHVYTPQDVAEVIEFARLRGIRVIPEFDTPGHAHSWGKGRPELLTPCWKDGRPGTADYGNHSEYENFDPTKETTFEFLGEFMAEVADVFPDQFLHVGMDEAHYMCWQSSPNITEFMIQKDFGPEGYSLLEGYYVSRAIDIISKTGKTLMLWQDPLDNGVVVNVSNIIQVWKDKDGRTAATHWEEYANNLTARGHNVVVSSCYYLNYISYGQDWRTYYRCDPHNFNGTQEQNNRILGGEACMWAEYVDGTNFLQRAWPRAAAVAERLWSPRDVTSDVDTAAFRLDVHRCRLLRRGVPAQPILPGFCGDYDFGLQSEITAKTTTSSSDNNNMASVNFFSQSQAVILIVLYTLWYIS